MLPIHNGQVGQWHGRAEHQAFLPVVVGSINAPTNGGELLRPSRNAEGVINSANETCECVLLEAVSDTVRAGTATFRTGVRKSTFRWICWSGSCDGA